MKSIVVSGATSMIGKALIDTAIREEIEVYALVRPNTRHINRLPDSPLIHIIQVQLDQFQKINSIPTTCDVFYHFAWVGTAKVERNDPLLQESNIRYSLDAVELARKMGCQRFIGAGSQAEYGFVNGIIDYETKHAPVTAYGIAKYAAGILTGKRCEQLGIEHIWTRIFSVYGPEDSESSMLNTAISDFLSGKTAHFSAAIQFWNYLYESDAGELLFRLGTAKDQGVWLVAGKESRPLKDYILEMMNVFGPEAKAEFAPQTGKPLLGLNVNAEQTFQKLNYSPRVSFQDGIRHTIEARKQMLGII